MTLMRPSRSGSCGAGCPTSSRIWSGGACSRQVSRSPWQALNGAGSDGAYQLSMVPLILAGVHPGELADRGGEFRALPDVAGNGHRIAGAGVGPGQCLAARGGELSEARGDQLRARDDLHVAELPYVIVLAAERAPPGENVGGALNEPLAADHPRAVVAVLAGLGVGLIHGRPGLLDLQEQRVGAAAALQQHQVDLHPHAAYPDDLADHVDLSEPAK